ncbi:hypothetical protein CQ018_14335 [Arthrobacter sp. MYb227]|uniref:hypothetical protein n=1 Tax=Arthrobacter sp. MYb227 TaxID=1848601 RepID=UPI000CFBEF32|nr:hypothetical protein [Arthrobacter sp. MYb227]PQZ91137.1 hypothetical protein CQ018_14335 [Arthrobacter sp. MYb227]
MKLNLQERERVLVKTRAHPRALRGVLIRFLILIPIFGYLAGFLIRTDLPGWLTEASPLLLALVAVTFIVLLFIWCLAPLTRWARTWIYLTNQHIITKRGRTAAGQRSIGLYAIQDVRALTKARATNDAPGTLQVVVAEQRINIANLPAVHKMRELSIGAISALPHFPRVDSVNMEERVEPEYPTHPQQRDWTEHE